MVNDPIGDFIIQLKNAGAVRKDSVALPYSKLKFAVASKLMEGGYVKGVSKRGKKARKCLEVELLYTGDGSSAIIGVKRVSRPGRRVYQGTSHIHSVYGGRGSLILSTPKGILTDREARKEHVGGEALFMIW